MINLTAPPISSEQRKELEKYKARLESAIGEVEADYEKVAALRKKEGSLEKEAESLHRDAAAFHRDAEIKLSATLKQIERCHEAIHTAESEVYESKGPLFNIVDQAQEFIRQACQVTYNELLDQIAVAVSPYYSSFNDARHTVGRNAPAVNDLVTNLLGHRASPDNSIERLFEAARNTLHKVDALLTGSEIWSYKGAKVPSSEKLAESAA